MRPCILSVFLASLTTAVHITQDTVSYYPTRQDLSKIHVDYNVFFSLLNYKEITTNGAADINGQFFVTAQSGNPPVVWRYEGIRQGVDITGLMVLDNSAALGSEHLTFYGSYFQNRGRFYMLNSPDTLISNSISLHISTSSIRNTGSFVIVSQKNAPKSIAFDNNSHFENIGVICLLNSILFSSVPHGHGCIYISGGEVMVALRLTSLGHQTFFLAGDNSTLKLMDAVNAGTHRFRVRGFGSLGTNSTRGNSILIGAEYQFDSYEPRFGEVSLRGDNFLLLLEIGPNYDPQYFVHTGNRFSYKQKPPSSKVPNDCKCDFNAPKAPTSIPNSSSASAITMSSQSSTPPSQ